MANLLGTNITGAATISDRIVIGGNFSNNAYNSVSSTRLHFGGGNSDALENYYIGTNLNDYGGNYTKLDLRWHTGIRMGAQPGYGGIRFYDTEDLGTVIFSVGTGDANVRVTNNLYINGNTAIHTGNIGSQSVNYASSAGSASTANNTTQFYAAGSSQIKSSTPGTSYSNHIQVREADGGYGNTNSQFEPALGFHWGNVVASNIAMEASGRIAIKNNPGTGYEAFISSITYSSESARAPIFYDSADTNYYVDPNSNSYLSTLRVAGASGGVSLSVGNGSTHGVYADNARKYLVVAADYYPHMALVASGSNNTTHGPVFSFVGTEGSSFRQWNIGISNQNPFLFSIGYNSSGDANPHYGVGDAWSGNDAHHARLSIDRDGNTKIRGMLYVNGTSGGISTGNAVIHAGNIGSQSVNYASSAGNSSQLQGYSASAIVTESRGMHSGSDFPNGTLVRTDIDANGWAGDSFVMEVSGKSYSGSSSPFKLVMQGYLYADSIINVSAMSYGSYFPGPVKVMRLDGNLAFWWPRGSYWNSFEVHVRNANGDSWNRVTNIDDSVDPPSADKKISITPIQVLHTNNAGYAYNMNQNVRTTDGPTFQDVYTAGWFRNYGYQGIYNQTYGTHFYSNSGASWAITGSGGNVELQFRSNHQSTVRGYVYADTDNNIGFLNSGGSWSLRVDNAGNSFATSSFRAPIFYDSNDTGYYLDPNSTSNLLTVNILNTYVGNAIYFGGGNNYFNWDGARINSNVGIQSGSDMRAPIFYDSNDTTYYLDPNNTLLGLKIAGNIDMYARSASWAEGIRVRVPSTSTWGGIRFTRDRGNDDGNWAIGFTGIDSTDDLTFWGNTGGTGAMRMRLDQASNLITYGSMRAPVFYDSDNTGFYLDPANSGTSLNMNGRMVGNSWTTYGRNYNHEWIEFPNYTGLYSPNNGAHFRPNFSNYGSWLVTGTRNGWRGIEFESGNNGNVNLMISVSSSASGFHNNSYGWQFRWDAGTLYCHKNTYGGGTQAVVLDSVNLTNYAAPVGIDYTLVVNTDAGQKELVFQKGSLVAVNDL